MSYNGNYTPLVSVRHQFNSGHWLKCLHGGMVDTCALEAHAERCSGSSPDEGTDGDFRFLIFNIYLMICKECKKEFSLPKNIINGKIKRNGMGPQFCSKECWADFRREEVELNCAECNKPVVKKQKEIRKSKTGNIFCSKSCSASFNNKNKKFGIRRSKLENWIENELNKKYKFEIIYNGKEAIESELDIYIPSLNLAFELNGIFHYEPIYGEGKLSQVKNNDGRKFQACLERKIELCIIDVSSSKHFKPERDKKYLDIIINLIELKCRGLVEKNQLS